MQKLFLQWKKATRIALMMLLPCMMGISYTYASEKEVFDFSASCPTGQTLYYKIIDATNHYVKLTYPGINMSTPWDVIINGVTTNTEPTGPITIPETVTHGNITYTVTVIGDHTFHKCDFLTGSLVIPNTVTTIEDNAFSNCSGFNGTLTIGNSVTSIGTSAFRECSGFTGSLVIPNSVTTIGPTAFYMCSGFNGTLTLSDNLTKIGVNAFDSCSGFTGSLTIPNSIAGNTNLGIGAFQFCSGFNGSLKLSENMTAVRQRAFNGCSGFTGDLVIPKKCVLIQEYAFGDCTGFSRIYLCSNSVVSSGSGAAPLYNISSTKPIYVPTCLLTNYNSHSYWQGFSKKYGRTFFNEEGNWSNSTKWACGALPGNSKYVVVAANCNVDCSTANLTHITILKDYSINVAQDVVLNCTTIENRGTAANLIVQNNAQIYHNNANVQATILKDITAYTSHADGWQLIASPVAANIGINSVENLVSNNIHDLYYYDEPTVCWINYKDGSNNFTQLNPGKGYLYANDHAVELAFPGKLNAASAQVQIPLSYSEGSRLTGFNLVGNPYAHNVTSYTGTNVAENCYRMNETNTDFMVSEISETEPLKPAEGFFVKATNGSDSNITFGGGKPRSEITRTGSIKLEIKENGKIVDRLIVKRDEVSNDFPKLSIKDNRTKIFAQQDNQEFAIVVCNEYEQAVDFKTNNNGTYTISVTIDDIDTDYLHLIDNFTGDNIDLLVTPSYTFDAKKSDFASRFRLIFDPIAYGDPNDENFAFINDGSFIIANEGIATLQIMDVTGRILSSETINNSIKKPINLKDGIYILRLVNSDSEKSQKIVVMQ